MLPARGLRAGRAGTAARLTLLALSGATYMAVRVLLTTPAGAPLSLRTASLQTSQLVRRAENPLTFVRGRVPRLLSTAWIQVALLTMAPLTMALLTVAPLTMAPLTMARRRGSRWSTPGCCSRRAPSASSTRTTASRWSRG